MDVYIWGTGKKSQEVYDSILYDEVRILGIIDNDPQKIGKEFNGHRIVSFSSVISFDYIIVAVIDFRSIEYQLKQNNIKKEKIIYYYAEDNKEYFFLDNKQRKINILSEKLDSMKRILTNRLLNYKYEETLAKLPVPKFGKTSEAIEQIVCEHKSIIRFGDGEFNIIFNIGSPVFQEYSEELSYNLQEILQDNTDKLIIAIAKNYESLDEYTEEVADGIRHYMTEEVRMLHNSVLDLQRVYYDAYMFKCFYPYKDKENTINRLNQVKKIWQDRNVVVIEGNLTRTGVNNMLLSNSKAVKRVLCPTINAYEKYYEIVSYCKKLDKDNLFLISLGPAGKVLAYELYKNGFQVVDVGQIDMDFEWYMSGVNYKTNCREKYVSQLPPISIGNIESESYVNEILVDFS